MRERVKARMEGKKTRPFSSSSTQEQSPNDALQVSDQFSSLLQTNFDLDSPAFSHSDHSFAFQQQQPQTKASLSTPEAYWSECAERALAERRSNRGGARQSDAHRRWARLDELPWCPRSGVARGHSACKDALDRPLASEGKGVILFDGSLTAFTDPSCSPFSPLPPLSVPSDLQARAQTFLLLPS